MFNNHVLAKRLIVYVGGLLLLSFGVVLSIQASMGVSPVSSLAYALALVTPLSVGIMVVLSNFLFIALQYLLDRSLSLQDCLSQIATSLVFCVFIDAELYFIKDILPADADLWIRVIYLICSSIIIATALLLYLTPRFQPLSYDALTKAVAKRLQWPFGKAKIMCDLINVCLSAAICLIFIQRFGSIGIGTLFAAYSIGRIAAVLMKRFLVPLNDWMFKN